MAYPEKYYVKAQQELDKRRFDNGRETDRHNEEIREKVPGAKDIIEELAGTTSRLADIIFSHRSDSEEQIEKLKQRNLYLQQELSNRMKQFGYPYDYIDEIYTCKICKDTGIDGNHRCSCFNDILRKIASQELSSGLPISDYSFENFSLSYYSKTEKFHGREQTPFDIMSKTFEKCKSYAEDFHLPYNGLIMYGATGLGKTHLSLAIASKVIEKGYSALYTSVPDLLHKIESAHFGRSDDEDVMTTAKECDLLVLDDLGAEFPSPFYTSCIYEIINSRLNFGRPIIISTNLSSQELSKIYNDRVASRVYSMNKLLFAGTDIRNLKK